MFFDTDLFHLPPNKHFVFKFLFKLVVPGPPYEQLLFLGLHMNSLEHEA